MPHRHIDFQFLAAPSDVNFGGKVHGGMLMKWMDQAGYACAVGWTGSYCVTISVGAIRFRNPVYVGQLVHLHAQVVHTGKTSVQVFISVEAADPKTMQAVETNHCIMTFAAMSDAGELIAVPTWEPQSADDYLLEHYAVQMKGFSSEAERLLTHRQQPFAIDIFDGQATHHTAALKII